MMNALLPIRYAAVQVGGNRPSTFQPRGPGGNTHLAVVRWPAAAGPGTPSRACGSSGGGGFPSRVRERVVFRRRCAGRSGCDNCARSSTDRASDYGSEGWGFESLRARSVLRQTTRPLTSGNAGGGLARSSSISSRTAPVSGPCCRDAAGTVSADAFSAPAILSAAPCPTVLLTWVPPPFLAAPAGHRSPRFPRRRLSPTVSTCQQRQPAALRRETQRI